VALTQPYAYAELRRHAGTQFDPEVVEAFIKGMESSGHRYGSKVELTDDEARDLAAEGLEEIRKADQIHGRDFPLAPIREDADNG
jgi:HD-GYP domain-containing protein (c-di-GMP phosphodiesterase class II)